MSNVGDTNEEETVSIQTMEALESSPISIDSNNRNTNERTDIYLEIASYSNESEDNKEMREANDDEKLTSVVEYIIEYVDNTDNNVISSLTIQDANGENIVVEQQQQQAPHRDCYDDYDMGEEPIKGGKIINNGTTSIAISTYDESNDDTGKETKQKSEANDEIGKNNEIENNNNNGDKEAKIENMIIEKMEFSQENSLLLTELNSSMDNANGEKTTKDDSINGYQEQQQQQQQQDAITVGVQGQGDDVSVTNIETNEIISLEKDKDNVLLDSICDDESNEICSIQEQQQPDEKKQLVHDSAGEAISHLEVELEERKEEKGSANLNCSNTAQEEEGTLSALEIFARNIVECEIRNYIESVIATVVNNSLIIEEGQSLEYRVDINIVESDKTEIIAKEAIVANGVTQYSDEEHLAAGKEKTFEQTSDHTQSSQIEVSQSPIVVAEAIKSLNTEQVFVSDTGDETENFIETTEDNDDNGETKYDNDTICDTNKQIETVIISSVINEDMALNSANVSGDISTSQQLLNNKDDVTRTEIRPIASGDDNVLDEELEDNDVDDDEKEPLFVARQVVMKRNKNPRDEYSLKEELGRGKFGTVYKCLDNANGTQLAAKFIHLRRKEDREDVEREVDIMKSLQHKRLLQLYDAFDDGHYEMCLIMELVEGGELFERVIDDDFKLTEKMAAIFMRQICEGVRYMQEQNIVHLDMKPENILCVSKKSNRIKLIDFGLARRLEPNSKLQVLFGTPDFAAPEVLSYDNVTLATDMWSVGVICYVLLSGLSPFMGDTDLETMTNVTRAAYDFEDEAFDPISDSARDFISRLLVKDQALRMNPSECLVHNWLTKTKLTSADVNKSSEGNGAFDQSLDKTKLRKYVVRRKWQKAIHAILALRRMGATF